MTHVDPLVLRQAAWQASALIRSSGYAFNDWQDIRQELILDCLRRTPKFDSSRGEWAGFVRGVMRNHAAVLVVRQRRRAPEASAGDLPQQVGSGDADVLEILDTRSSSGGVDALHVMIDVHRVLEDLPPDLQSLAKLLGQMPVRDVCRRVGKSRSRVYQMIHLLRDAFLRAGLSPANARRSSESAK